MTAPPSDQGSRLNAEQRLVAYQNKLRALKERSSLREVMERELLLDFIEFNQGKINEYPLLPAQQTSVKELLCGRGEHPGYEYIHQHIANFIVLLAHYEKAIKSDDASRVQELQDNLLNIESILIKCVQGIVYAMALITDNFEEIILRYFGQVALREYSALIEKYQLNETFWKAFIEQFVASRVEEAHREILEGEKYKISKEKNFLVIRFLFDDILAKLNPTDQTIKKTRIQQQYVESRAEKEGMQRVKLLQSILIKGMSHLSNVKELDKTEFEQATRILCIDNLGKEFEALYREHLRNTKEQQTDSQDNQKNDTLKQEQARLKFLMDQVVAVGVGATIAIGCTSDFFYAVLNEFVPDEITGIRPMKKDFSIPALERILYFLLENNTIHILREVGRSEGSKIQIRSSRSRRVPEAAVNSLSGLSRIRKKQLFTNDATRKDSLLFRPRTAQQMAKTMALLSLEPELQAEISTLWQKAFFRVDIMVLLNLEQIARTTTNLKTKLAEILDKYGVTT